VRALALLLLLVSLACKGGSPQQAPPSSPAELPTYVVHRAKAPLTIDGVLAESAWDAAEKVALVRSVDGRAATWATEVRLLWDDQRLYAGFLAEDKNISTPFQKDDEPLYTSNVVEIFLNPKGDLRRYFEIEVSPANVLFDASFTGRRQGMDLAWSSRAAHAVHLDGTLNDPRDVDRGWSAELAVPFAALDGASPKVGDEWRFNLFRLLQGPGQPNEGQAYSAPLTNDFHAVNRFARLRFAE
jgi:hypothetical protein